ncbi:MAG: DUF4435 domain-containing protein [Deltaproteobacteria bacterium]|nr:DUF4435 domain-containing protein [Deltaproteobacteria bacterium]
MTAPAGFDELELALRGGSGVAIICEGETYRQDEAVFRRWFERRAREVTFHAQNGWRRVVHAVEQLRRLAAPVPVYGIVDRDFAPDAELERQHAAEFRGPVFRLPRCTIENYLLEPAGWHEVVRALHVREPQLPTGWDSLPAVSERLSEAYRASVPVAAHNWTVHVLRERFERQAGFCDTEYLRHSGVAEQVDLGARLAAWAGGFGAADEARAEFAGRRDLLVGLADPVRLSTYVSGKLVLQRVQQDVPIAAGRRRPAVDELVDRYLDKRPEPPEEILGLVARILAVAHHTA